LCRFAPIAPLDLPGTELAINDMTALHMRFFQSHAVFKETAMQWTTPAYTDLRFGFEITMYIANR
jgi:coenzyme PQQ precursor peptide PqqA